VETYLPDAVESLAKQLPINAEVIMVDDGTKDRSGRMCDEYAAMYANFRVVHKENGGLVSARKAGLQVAEGKYIGFLDGDDWVDKDYYAQMLEKALAYDADVVCSSFVFHYPAGEEKARNVIEDGLYTDAKLRQLREKMLYTKPYYTYGIAPSLCMKLIKKSWMNTYLMRVPNKITLAEDASCSFPIMFQCNRIYVLHTNCGYHYRQIEQSMTRAYDANKMSKIRAALIYCDQALGTVYDQYRNQVDKFFGSLVKEMIANEMKSPNPHAEKIKKLAAFRENAIVDRTLQNVADLPCFYKILFVLYRDRNYRRLVCLLDFYNRCIRKPTKL
jgi:glycosyltransferase involved in cell wall biosynthesis